MKPHRVNVMRPTKHVGGLGETQGTPEVVCNGWQCSIRTLSGKEQESARQTGADAQYEVEGHGDPKWTDLEECYLQFGERRLNIEFIDDEQLNGIKLRLLCGENK